MSNVEHFAHHARWTKAGYVDSHLAEPEIAGLEERQARGTADPHPLGLWGFATGTWIVGTIIAGVFPPSAVTAAIPVLFVFAGLTQFIAGLFAFRRPNVLAATAFCSFGAFNVTAAFFYALQALHFFARPEDAAEISGFLLVSFSFIALALTVAAMRTNLALVVVLGTLAIGYALSGIPNLNNGLHQPVWGTIEVIGGWFLVASAFFAYYTGMAIAVNSMWNRKVLPLGGPA